MLSYIFKIDFSIYCLILINKIKSKDAMKNILNISLLIFIVSCGSENDEIVLNQSFSDPPSLNSFSFLSSINPNLERNVTLNFENRLNGQTFTGVIDANINISELIPTFSFTGSHVSVNGMLQQSGISTNNFNNIITYTVSNDDGIKKNYIIDITKFTGLPIINITTDNSEPIISKEVYLKGSVDLDGWRYFEDLENLSMKIRGRGHSTWTHPKKPFQMKLSDKSSFLGMPSDKKWLFLAEYSDKTMLRNTIAFELGHISNLEWTPASQFAEVFINNEYNGTYNITQKVEESDNRVALGDDGYLLELDQWHRLDFDDIYFESTITDKFIINIKEPSITENSDQYNYIKNLISDFEKALFSDEFKDQKIGYKKYIDIESFIDWYLISEITKNVDSQWYSSIYLNVIPGEKIKMGPLWDFDLSFGNTDYADTRYYFGWWVKYNPWYDRLFQDPSFLQMVKNRFNYFNNNKDYIIKKIDMHADKLILAQEKNDEKWGTIGRYVWPNPVVYDSYDEEVEHLKNWYLKRMKWLDEAFKEL